MKHRMRVGARTDFEYMQLCAVQLHGSPRSRRDTPQVRVRRVGAVPRRRTRWRVWDRTPATRLTPAGRCAHGCARTAGSAYRVAYRTLDYVVPQTGHTRIGIPNTVTNMK